MWTDTSNTQSAMWQKNHDPPKFQYVQGRRAFTGYSNFSVRFWHAGQKCPDRYWPAGITMQDWHTLQQEQTQTSQRKQQENNRESVASHFALGDDAGKPLRRGGWQSAISEPLRRGGWPSSAGGVCSVDSQVASNSKSKAKHDTPTRKPKENILPQCGLQCSIVATPRLRPGVRLPESQAFLQGPRVLILRHDCRPNAL